MGKKRPNYKRKMWEQRMAEVMGRVILEFTSFHPQRMKGVGW